MANEAGTFEPKIESLPYIPKPSVPWRAFSILGWIAVVIFGVVGVVRIFMHKWFTESVGVPDVFWTDFWMGLKLFLIFGTLFALAVVVPTFLYARNPALKTAAISIAVRLFVVGGGILSFFYHDFLLSGAGADFGRTDPVFGNDFGFYVFTMPAIWIAWWGVLAVILFAVTFFLIARLNGLTAEGGVFREKPELDFGAKFALVLNRGAVVLVCLLGLWGAAGTFLSRYVLLYWNHDNEGTEETSGVLVGTSYLDITGLFSNLNTLYLTVVVLIVLTVTLSYLFTRSYGSFRHLEVASAPARPPMVWRRAHVMFVIGVILFDGAFFGVVQLKRLFVVMPNEPRIQKEFIEAHVQHTLEAYGMDDVQVVEWKEPATKLPPSSLASNKTVTNSPLVPGFVSDGGTRDKHLAGYRIKNEPFYAPTLEIYHQRQQLRPYYQFMNIDNVRYRIGGEKKMFASAVRELPMGAVVDKGKHNWGSTALQYTHGFGMVASPVNELDENGDLVFVSKDIPPKTSDALFDVEPRVYYGEGGAGRHILTNLKGIKEFDYANAQSRLEYELPEGVGQGIRIDGWFKRLILALWSYQPDFGRTEVPEFLFTRFIDHGRTRAHVYRDPAKRALAVAPFLLIDDQSTVASACDGRIVWLVNGLSVSSTYPYSRFRQFNQTNLWGNAWNVNYMEDSVKITVDAYTGEMIFYQITDDPVISAWARVYPSLFRPMSQMPEAVRSQLNYPMSLFHVQFDDTYKRYHQKNYLEFYNMEDLWDDADEALGLLSDEKTVSYHATHYLVDPTDLPPGVEIESTPGDTQYVLMQPFTPKDQRNLRAVVMVFQDPENYGKIVSFQVPQGEFLPSPEQADAIIDADPHVNQQLTLWQRSGAEAINGHTLLLPVGGDVCYVEPIFVKSTLNNYPRLAMVATLYDGRVTMGSTLDEALLKHGQPRSQLFGVAPPVSTGAGAGR